MKTLFIIAFLLMAWTPVTHSMSWIFGRANGDSEINRSEGESRDSSDESSGSEEETHEFKIPITVNDVSDRKPFIFRDSGDYSKDKDDEKLPKGAKTNQSRFFSDHHSFIKYFGGSVIAIGILAFVYKALQKNSRIHSFISQRWGRK